AAAGGEHHAFGLGEIGVVIPLAEPVFVAHRLYSFSPALGAEVSAARMRLKSSASWAFMASDASSETPSASIRVWCGRSSSGKTAPREETNSSSQRSASAFNWSGCGALQQRSPSSSGSLEVSSHSGSPSSQIRNMYAGSVPI